MKTLFTKPTILVLSFLLLSTAIQAQHWKRIMTQTFGKAPSRKATAPYIYNSQNSTNDVLPGTSDYTVFTDALNTSSTGNPGDGSYKVTTWTGRVDKAWVWGYDHTAVSTTDSIGYGLMMLINADPIKKGESVGSYYVYRTASFDVPGGQYRVGFWAANVLRYDNSRKAAYIGLNIRNTPDNTGTQFIPTSTTREWVLPRTTNTDSSIVPWQNREILMILPVTYSDPALYFNFYNSDVDGSTQGNDLVLDDIYIDMQMINISGTIFNDLNSDGTIAGSEPGVNGTTTPAYVYVTKADGTIIGKAQVKTDGTYILEVPAIASNTGMKLLVSSQNLAEGATITTATVNGYGIVSENVNGNTGANTGTTGTDGIIGLTNTTSDLSNINIGVNALPMAYPITQTITGAPVPGQPVVLNALQGSDPINNQTQGSWSAKTIVIDTLPTNGFELYYNGVKVTQGQSIPNYDPTKLTVQATATTPGGTNSTVFQYSVVDNQTGKSTPATYTVNFSIALPVVFGAITAKVEDGLLVINWQAVSETNNAYYEIEASTDGINFKSIGRVETLSKDGNSTVPVNYHFTKDAKETGSLALAVSLFAAAFSVLLISRKNKLLFGLALFLGIGFFGTSCQKKADKEIGTQGNLFIRILQVDKDGTASYSQVVKVVND